MKYEKRLMQEITKDDLQKICDGSQKHLSLWFADNPDSPVSKMYAADNPIAVALCQGAAMHYYNSTTGYTDFDVWFFYAIDDSYPPTQRNPAKRQVQKWYYENPKFPCGKIQVDVMLRSIHNCTSNPADTIRAYLQYANSSSSRKLMEKAAVLLHPNEQLGKVVWADGNPIN